MALIDAAASARIRGRARSLEVDLAPGPQGSRPGELMVAGDRLYFTADDGASGRQLWVLDPG